MKLPVESVETFNINCVGSWNPAIFTPEWVKEKIAVNQEKEVILAVQMGNISSSPPRIEVDDVHLYPSRQNLMINSIEFNGDSISSCLMKLKRVAELLPHTPVTDIGFNFRYICDLAENQLIADLFSFSDAARIDADIYTPTKVSLHRTFEMDGKPELNLLIDAVGTELKFTFNFNINLKSFRISLMISMMSLFLSSKQSQLAL